MRIRIPTIAVVLAVISALPAAAQTVPFTTPVYLPGPGGFTAILEVADLNHDGVGDVIMTPPQYSPVFCTYLSAGTVWQPAVFTATRSVATDLRAMDMDGDGDLDLVSASADSLRVFSNDGTGHFSQLQPTAVPGCFGVAQAGVNSAGLPDLAVMRDAVGLFGTRFVASPSGLGSDLQVKISTSNIFPNVRPAFGDFRGDGRVGIVATGGFGSPPWQILSFECPPSPSTQLSGTVLGLGSIIITQIEAADFNEDGIDDLAVLYGLDRIVQILFGSSTGDFVPGPSVDIPLATTYAMGVGDLDQDGHVDVVCGGSGTLLSVMRGTGQGTFISGGKLPTLAGLAGIAIKDLDGDSLPDLITCTGYDSNTQKIGIRLNRINLLNAPGAHAAVLRLSASPNPSSGAEFALSLALPAAGHARVSVYDVTGRQVATLADGDMAAGTTRLRWDAVDAPPGVYQAIAETSGGRAVKRLVRVK